MRPAYGEITKFPQPSAKLSYKAWAESDAGISITLNLISHGDGYTKIEPVCSLFTNNLPC